MRSQNLRLDPKASFYASDGSGRDSYIMVNNGGNTAQKEWNKQPCSGAFLKIGFDQIRVIRPQSCEKRSFYTSDGSGRDGYINTNSGGMCDVNTILDRKRYFFSTFRRIDMDFSQLKRAINYNPMLATSQLIQARKLSVPKRKNTPFTQTVTEQFMVNATQAKINRLQKRKNQTIAKTLIQNDLDKQLKTLHNANAVQLSCNNIKHPTFNTQANEVILNKSQIQLKQEQNEISPNKRYRSITSVKDQVLLNQKNKILKFI